MMQVMKAFLYLLAENIFSGTNDNFFKKRHRKLLSREYNFYVIIFPREH